MIFKNIILATVMVAFFSSFSVKSDGYPADFDFTTLSGVAPKNEASSLISCMGPQVTASGINLTKNEILDACKPIFEETWLSNSSYSLCGSTPTITYVETVGYLKGHISHKIQNGNSCYPMNGTSINSVQGYLVSEVIVKTCPPDESPEFGVSKDLDGDGEIDICYMPYDPIPENECGEGEFKYKLYDVNTGEGKCVAVDCDSQGSTNSIRASGSIYGNSQGTYCDGSCAYSVSGGQNDSSFSGNLFIDATSTGSSCGDGSLDDRWFDEGNGDECQTSPTSSGGSFLKCPVGSGEDPDSPDSKIDLSGNKLSEIDIPTLVPVVEVCGVGDSSCEIRNLKESIKSQEQVSNDLAIKAQNNNIDASQKSSQAIVSAIEGLRDSNVNASNHDSAGGGNNGDGDTTGGGGDGEEGECSEDGECTSSVELRQEPNDGLEGFWETEYEDGIEGMFEEKVEDLKQTEFYLFLEEFNPDIGGGSPPMFTLCFNFGPFGHYGCQTIEIDPRVYPALKVFVLISAGFGCRRILFGG